MMLRVRHPLALPGLVLATAFACVAPATAGVAATLTTDARCYAQGAPLKMTAEGLTPNAPLTVALDGQPLRYGNGATATANGEGGFASSFSTPALAPGVTHLRYVLSVDDGTHRPRARFTVTRSPGAAFSPSEGNPRTLRARFSVWAFALASGRNARAYLHWVGPGGEVRKNAALGMTEGDCGTLRTRPRRVFPFAAEPGRWLLVIDTHRRYRVQTDAVRAKIPVHVRPTSP